METCFVVVRFDSFSAVQVIKMYTLLHMPHNQDLEGSKHSFLLQKKKSQSIKCKTGNLFTYLTSVTEITNPLTELFS